MAFADALDSFFTYVKGRILAQNPQRGIYGIIDAADWPPNPINFESFYLLTQGFEPSSRIQSAAIPAVSDQVSWVWYIMGSDLRQGVVGRNRGDRYRTNLKMQQELIYGLFPGFCPKQTYSVNAVSNPPSLVGTLVVPGDVVRWQKRPNLKSLSEKQSGVLSVIATVRITDLTDEIDS